MYTQTHTFFDIEPLFFFITNMFLALPMFRGSCQAKNNSGGLKEQFSMARSPSLPPFCLLGVSPLLHA